VITPQNAITIEALVANDLLDQAFGWLCRQRKDWPADTDVWRFRRDWLAEKARLHDELLSGRYEIGLLNRVTLIKDGEPGEVDLWPARDAVVMKALTWTLQEHLPLSSRCMHIKGHGGLKQAVCDVYEALPQHQFVLKTDVKSYYASIDHGLLLDRLSRYIADERVMNLIVRYLRRCAERGGLFWEHRQGISLGCPLSPIIGAFFLAELDEQLDQTGLFWRRYMDDIIVLAPTRWKLRNAVKIVNRVLTSLVLQKHPDKTFIGHIAKGFKFLGYHFCPEGLTVAQETFIRFVVRALRLYEQKSGERCASTRLEAYIQRWVRWVKSGILNGLGDNLAPYVMLAASIAFCSFLSRLFVIHPPCAYRAL
jgi:hypothetical protein